MWVVVHYRCHIHSFECTKQRCPSNTLIFMHYSFIYGGRKAQAQNSKVSTVAEAHAGKGTSEESSECASMTEAVSDGRDHARSDPISEELQNGNI